MGVVDRRGKHTSNACSSRRHCRSIPGQAEAVFLPFSIVESLAKVPESTDRAIFVPTMMTTTMDKPITLPLAHARGVKSKHFSYQDYFTYPVSQPWTKVSR